jgi:CheY-like chemotaxis protein
VLLNLLDNAVKFTEQGEVVLRAGTRSGKYEVGSKGREQPIDPLLPTPYSLLRFEVQDTGIGIPPDQLEHIFQPFEQVRGLAHRTEGTGLGLAISSKLVGLMGGDMHVQSPPAELDAGSPPVPQQSWTQAAPAELDASSPAGGGEVKGGPGSTFWFEVVLPVTEVAVEAVPLPAPDIVGYKGPRRTILVVDDIPSNRAVLVDLLKPLGFEVIEAADGWQAIQLAQETRPDLILMDRWMPVLDGFEATQQMRQIPALTAVPVVAVSASVSKEDQAQSWEAGINAFLPKPVNWPRLAALLEEHLGLEWESLAPHAAQVSAGGAGGEEEMGAREGGAAALVLPPQEELEVLLDLALRGDLLAIEKQATQLEQLDERLSPFAGQLRRLAKDFEDRAILALIKQHVEQG